MNRIMALFAVAALMVAAPALADTCSSTAICTGAAAQLTNASSTNPVTLFTAPSGNGTKILQIACSWDVLTGSPPAFSLSVLQGGTSYPLFSAFVSGAAGLAQNSGNTVNLLLTSAQAPNPPIVLPTDENGNAFLILPSGTSLQMAAQSSITAGHTLSCRVTAQTY